MLGLVTLLQAAAPVLGAATVDPIVRDGVRVGAYPGAVFNGLVSSRRLGLIAA